MARDIPREALTRYNQLVSGVSETANATLAAQMVTDPPATLSDLRRQLSTTLKAADSASFEIDRQFYQEARRYVTGDVMRAREPSYTTPWNDYYLERTLKAMAYEHGTYDPETDTMEVDDPDAFSADLAQFVARMVNDGSKRHIESFGARDPIKPRYARVPSGLETCAWCWALAGLGFQYKSAEAASHSHASCDCVVVPSWNGSGVVGYDPEYYANMFRSAQIDLEDGNVSEELMRRVNRRDGSVAGYNRRWEGTLAVMREKYGLK